MKRKYRILVSIILLALSIGLCVLGVALFNKIPDVNTVGYTNPKDALLSTGMTFAFIFAVILFGGSIGFMIYSFVDYEY